MSLLMHTRVQTKMIEKEVELVENNALALRFAKKNIHLPSVRHITIEVVTRIHVGAPGSSSARTCHSLFLSLFLSGNNNMDATCALPPIPRPHLHPTAGAIATWARSGKRGHRSTAAI